jgi:hypothetical protein
MIFISPVIGAATQIGILPDLCARVIAWAQSRDCEEA